MTTNDYTNRKLLLYRISDQQPKWHFSNLSLTERRKSDKINQNKKMANTTTIWRIAQLLEGKKSGHNLN